MKYLIYKEFKLSMHPMCYVFVFAFPLLALIPNYPMAISLIYIGVAYPILFLGANKGQQSNDLLYSMLLPVRRKDIVLSRMFTVFFMQISSLIMLFVLSPIHTLITNSIVSHGGTISDVGLGPNAIVTICAVALIGYSVLDLIFFSIYYKRGKSIVLSTLLSLLCYITILMIGTLVPYYIEPISKYFVEQSYFWVQLIALGIGILVYMGLHYLTYRISSKELEKVDF